MAQDNYVPPPMFDAPTMNAQPQENPVVLSPKPSMRPRISRSNPVPAAPAPAQTKSLLPPAITQGDPAAEKPKPKTKKVTAPKPAAKPKKPATIKEVKAPVTPKVDIVEPAAPAVPVINQPVVEKPVVEKPTASPMKMPAARVTSKGVVTGPKTMPSVPTTSVTAEETFRPATQTQTMMERHQQQQKSAAPKVAVIEPAAAAPSLPDQALQTGNEDLPKLTIPFDLGITQAQDAPLASLVQALRTDKAQQVMINAYANPTDDGENSDRRIALARALDLRKTLIAQQVESYRINIRAYGSQTDVKPADRVDLILYKPQESAN